MKSYNLFLDDFRVPADCGKYMSNPSFYYNNEWVIVRNYDEFVSFITKNGLPEVISFDHDLADEHYSQDMYSGNDVYDQHYKEFKEKTGLDCAKWLVDLCMDKNLDLPDYIVHSMNPAGARNIWSYLENYRKFREQQN
jgi:hypothetical protein